MQDNQQQPSGLTLLRKGSKVAFRCGGSAVVAHHKKVITHEVIFEDTPWHSYSFQENGTCYCSGPTPFDIMAIDNGDGVVFLEPST